MTYNKPDITALGDASSLILNGSGSLHEGAQKLVQSTIQTDGELDE